MNREAALDIAHRGAERCVPYGDAPDKSFQEALNLGWETCWSPAFCKILEGGS